MYRLPDLRTVARGPLFAGLRSFTIHPTVT